MLPRFGLVGSLDPWHGSRARFDFRVVCEGPHGVFISAANAVSLIKAVNWFLGEVEKAGSEGVLSLDFTAPLEPLV